MSHLAINPRTRFTRLAKIHKEYSEALEKANDPFEKAEYEGYLNTIAEFCIMRGGCEYYRQVVEYSKEQVK